MGRHQAHHDAIVMLYQEHCDAVGCNYFSLSLIPYSGKTILK